MECGEGKGEGRWDGGRVVTGEGRSVGRWKGECETREREGGGKIGMRDSGNGVGKR